MITPLEVSFTNFRRLEKFTHKYIPGTTGIVGKNGSGKSTFGTIGQIFAITGVVPDRFKKDDLLTLGKKSGQTVFKFMYQGLLGTLTRKVNGNGQSLILEKDGETIKEYTKAVEVNEAMQEILGMPYDMFIECCFVGQGKFIEVIEMNYSNRMAYFLRLTGLKKFETIRSNIQEEINAIPLYADRSDQIPACELEIETINKELANLALKEITKEEKRELLERKANLNKYLITALTESEYQRKIQNESALEKSLRAELAKASSIEKIEPQEPLSDIEKRMMSNYPTSVLYIKEMREIEAEASALKSKKEKEPEIRFSSTDKELLDKTRLAIIPELEKKIKLVKQGKCAECGSIITAANLNDLEKELENVREAYRTSKQAYDDDERKITEIRKRNLELDSKITGLRSAYTTKKKDLERLGVPDSFSKHDYTVLCEKHEKYCKYEKESSGFAKTAELKAKLDLCLTNIEKLKAEKFITLAEENEIQLQINEIDLKFQQQINRDKEQAVLTANRESQMKLLQSIRDEISKNAKVAELHRLLTDARQVLHYSELPKKYMNRLLHKVNNRLTYYLNCFYCEFSAQLSDDFEFEVNTRGHEGIPAYLILSGGQKVALALAFRFALADVLGAGIPLLVLDEPTVFLDEDNIGATRDVLCKIKSHIEKGTYLMIATHSKELEVAFTTKEEFQ